MGTNNLDDLLNYSMLSNAILKYIKDIENQSLLHHMSGLQKKEYVIKLIQNNIPTMYQENELMIDVMIDALVRVSNIPSLLKILSLRTSSEASYVIIIPLGCFKID